MEPLGVVSKSLQKITVLLLMLISLVCLHNVLLNLRSVLVPFVLSVILVCVVEPTVTILHRQLAGLAPPYRWWCCCCQRRRSQQRKHQAEHDGQGNAWNCLPQPDESELEPLLQESDEDHFCEGAARGASVLITIVLVIFAMGLLAASLIAGAVHLRESWPTYSLGAENLVKWLGEKTMELLAGLRLDDKLGKKTDAQIHEFYTYFLTKGQDLVSAVVEEILSGVSSCIVTAVIVLLYVIFGLLFPLPMGGQAGVLVRSYLWKKTFVSFLYAFWVSMLFIYLDNDMAIFFGLVSFFLNYVPEVGTIIAMILPAPFILLDGRLDSPGIILVQATLGQLVLKVVFNNIFETKLIQDDHAMSIHPLWVLLSINYFGYIWGPIGMMISVPILSVVKSTALFMIESAPADDEGELTKHWVQQFLACLEGRQSSSSLRPRQERKAQEAKASGDAKPEAEAQSV